MMRILFRLPWLVVLCWPVVSSALPAFEDVRSAYRDSALAIEARGGELLAHIRRDFVIRQGPWIPLKEISPALRQFVLLSEDQRFFDHAGVDWLAVGGALWSRIVHGGRRGASTLSMQVLGFIDERYRRGPSGRTFADKVAQALAARELEQLWTKAQILEAYLNLAPFRGELVGVGALAEVLFQKHASGLNARESALAASLLPAPSASVASLARRACSLLQKIGRPQECTGLRDFTDLRLQYQSAARIDRQNRAPHFARWAASRTPPASGTVLRTSIDAGLQALAVASVQRHLAALGASRAQDAAVVVLDNRTGEILAYVGSSMSLSDAPWVDHARALRQAGSTLKPFLYAQAIGRRRLTADCLLDDSPLHLQTGHGLYIPGNYDEHYAGWVSARTALASSLNIPAVRTLTMVTPPAFRSVLVRLGLPLDQDGDYYGHSLALGSADVTLLSLTNAYRALANGGRFRPVALTPQGGAVPAGIAVLPEAAAWIVGDILADRHARARTFGLDSPLSTSFWTAVKTGTSKDMRDNWCVGWSQDHTVGVWVGNSAGASMRGLSGVSGAGPIWHELMTAVEQGTGRDGGPPMPAGVSRHDVHFEPALEPPRSEFFIADTALEAVRLAGHAGGLRGWIMEPVSGTVLALDPDIPEPHQQVRLWAKAPYDGKPESLGWLVNGVAVGHGSSVYWKPFPGRHEIRLVDAAGRTLDAVRVEIRAGTPRVQED